MVSRRSCHSAKSRGKKDVKFWIDDTHDSPTEEQEARLIVDEHEETLPPQRIPTPSAADVPVFGARSMLPRKTPSPERREGLGAYP